MFAGSGEPAVNPLRIDQRDHLDAARKRIAYPLAPDGLTRQERQRGRKAQRIQEAESALEFLLPEQLPQHCILGAAAKAKAKATAKPNRGLTSASIVRSAFGVSLKESINDRKVLAGSATVGEDSSCRPQTVVADTCANRQDATITTRLNGINNPNEGSFFVKKNWDEAGMRVNIKLEALQSLLGSGACDFVELDPILKNGKHRKHPVCSAAIFQARASMRWGCQPRRTWPASCCVEDYWQESN